MWEFWILVQIFQVNRGYLRMPTIASRVRQGFRMNWIENVSIPFPHIAEIRLIEPTANHAALRRARDRSELSLHPGDFSSRNAGWQNLVA